MLAIQLTVSRADIHGIERFRVTHKSQTISDDKALELIIRELRNCGFRGVPINSAVIAVCSVRNVAGRIIDTPLPGRVKQVAKRLTVLT